MYTYVEIMLQQHSHHQMISISLSKSLSLYLPHELEPQHRLSSFLSSGSH